MARIRAGVRVDARAAVSRLSARLEGVSEASLDKAAARALVGVQRRAGPASKREVRKTYAVQAGAITSAFTVSNGKESAGSYVAVRASVQPVSLMRFGARWSKRAAGATAEIIRGERKTYGAAFIARLPNGARQVLARKPGIGPNGKRAPRYPLVRLNGPSPYQMVQGLDGGTARRITAELREYATVETLRQITLARGGRR